MGRPLTLERAKKRERGREIFNNKKREQRKQKSD
jgi:hypothetical protein